MKIFPFSRFIVADKSMIPAYKPKDHVLTFNWSAVSTGDVVVFELGRRKYLKRIDDVKENLVYVSGDNKKASLQMGPVEKNQIVGKVILRY